ncbi:MAG: response regulator [bacterium]
MTKILIVEDEPDLADVLKHILKIKGYEVKLVLDGYQAIEEVKKTHYDLILMDIRLPGLNGVETFLQIKEIDKNTTVIMMTGFAVEDLIETALERGAYACLHKPFDLDKVITLIAKAISENRPTILIVDDDEGIRENLCRILEEKGYRIYLAKDGQEALLMLKTGLYHCIILDLKLPKVDGIVVLKEAKQVNPNVVVIVITGYDLPDLLNEARYLSAYACLKKPIDTAELLKLLKETIK